MARILVIGASQGIGLSVCNAAAREGHTVRAMSRRGTAAADHAKLIEPFSGDALSCFGMPDNTFWKDAMSASASRYIAGIPSSTKTGSAYSCDRNPNLVQNDIFIVFG